MKLTSEEARQIESIFIKARNSIISADEAVVAIIKALSIEFKASPNYFVGIEVMAKDDAE